MLLAENHHSIITVNDVASICQPLAQTYDIHFFLYACVHDDNNVWGLVTDGNFQQHHFKKEYLITPPMPSFLLNRKKFYYLFTPSDLNQFNPAYYDFRSLFNVDHHLFMVERFDDYYELFIFGTKPENHSIINCYLNDIDYFEKFKFYFRDKAKKLLCESEKNKICIPSHMRSNFGGLKFNSNIEFGLSASCIKVNQYILKGEFEGVQLTKREIETLQQIANGLTMKETGKALKISPRTVETHFNNVKDKLGISRKSELIKTLLTLHLL